MRDTLLNKTGAIISAGPAQTDLDDPADGLSDAEPEIEWRELLAGAAQHGQRLDRALADGLPEFSRSYLQQLIEDGAVTVNGRPQHKMSTRLKAGDACRIGLRPTPQSRAFIPQAMDLAIVFADAHLLVIDKPAGLLTVPLAAQPDEPSLHDQVKYHLRSARHQTPLVVHRIDRDTSGLVVFAKTPEAMANLKDQFEHRQPERVYLAVVRGIPGEETGVWKDMLVWDQDELKQKPLSPGVTTARTPAKKAVCHYRVIERFAAASLLEIRLVTGKRNQIRIQASLHGHPLVGEKMYLNQSVTGPAIEFPRQALHSHRLSFTHPTTRQKLHFEAPLPADLQGLLERLRRPA